MCKYTTVYTIVDDFCKIYEEWVSHKLISSNKQRNGSVRETVSN